MPIRRCVASGARSIAAASVFLGFSCLLPLAGCGTNAGTVSVPPPTVSISASPASVTAGASSMLTVSAANATAVTVQGTDGSSYTLSGTGGTQSVTPAATTTYTAMATGMTGAAKAQTTVTVSAQPAPTVTITANPSSIVAGNSSTLTVTATGANAVTVTGSDGTSYTLSATGGTQSVTPAATTTYTAVATGMTASATAQVTVTVSAQPAPTVTITANPTSIASGNSSTLTVTATGASSVTVTGSDGTSYTLSASGGTQSVSPTATTTYTATANGPGGTATATATVAVTPSAGLNSIDHVIFMMQENRAFDSYFGMLNPYRQSNGWTQGADGNTYAVDGIDDKLTTISNTNDEGQTFNLFKFATTCIDDESSAWLASYGDVNTYDFAANRPILMNGFVHNAEGYAKSCVASNACSGQFTDTAGQRTMGYYDQGFLNYYYYMASQFALSDRWFSPVSTYTADNRIATLTGGTTQGLVYTPGDDGLPQLNIANIFEELDQNNVSWKLYFTVTQGFCADPDDCTDPGSKLPATDFLSLSYSTKYVYENPSGAQCVAPTQPSSIVGDTTNSYCIDPSHIAPISQFFTDLGNNALASFVWIDPGYANNDEHPGSGQSNLIGQAQVASILNAFMGSPEWKDSVFFLAYDEGGGPYDHVPPVPGHSNDKTDAMVGGAAVTTIPDISSIAVNPDSYYPCLPANGTPTLHCDLNPNDPGTVSTDAPAVSGFAAQLGFRVPNLVISPFTRAHYVSHIPMDHTAIVRFVENRFIGSSAHLTPRDAAQPNLLDFFDFTNIPWATPPSPPTPVSASSLGYNPCTPTNMGP